MATSLSKPPLSIKLISCYLALMGIAGERATYGIISSLSHRMSEFGTLFLLLIFLDILFILTACLLWLGNSLAWKLAVGMTLSSVIIPVLPHAPVELRKALPGVILNLLMLFFLSRTTVLQYFNIPERGARVKLYAQICALTLLLLAFTTVLRNERLELSRQIATVQR